MHPAHGLGFDSIVITDDWTFMAMLVIILMVGDSMNTKISCIL